MYPGMTIRYCHVTKYNRQVSCFQVCMGLRDRTVQVYDTEKSKFTESHSFLGGEGVFKGLYSQDK